MIRCSAFRHFASVAQRSLLAFFLLLFWPGLAQADFPSYFSLQQTSTLPTTLSSVLVQSPVLINVPAGTTLSVALMRGDSVVAISRLRFNAAYNNDRLVPPVPVASFYPTGSNVSPGEPLPGSTLTPGFANLDALAAATDQYRLLWELSDGIIGTPSRAVATSISNPLNLIDLKLIATSAAIRPGEQKPGSALFYHRYSSSAANPARDDTSLSLSNTSPTDSVYVRLFLVNDSCQPLDYTFCLNARQTISLLTSDFDPGSRGYAIAVACDAAGQPIQFNWLTGLALVKQPNQTNGVPYDLTLNATAVAKRTSGPVTPSNGVAEMAFDGVMYDQLPAQLAADNVPSQTGSLNNTTLIVYRPLPNLSGGISGAVFRVTGYNNNGDSTTIDVSATNVCYRLISLGSLRATPSINDLIPSGSTAWFSITPTDNLPLLGAQTNFGRFSTGNTARALSYVTDYRISIPVTALTCPN
jgi:hypothetical protein